jgi:tight adherence protein C
MPLPILIALVFFATASIVFFIAYVLMPKKSILEERLEIIAKDVETEISLLEKPLTPWQKFLARLGAIPIRPQDYGKYVRYLIAAGIRRERLPVFMGVKILLAIALPAIYLIFYGIPFEKDFTLRVLLSVAFAIVGFLAPSYWLTKKVKKRQLSIFHDLPDVLDLLTVCVEAGMSMDAAMIKVAEDPFFKKSPLITEMKIAIREVRAGKPRTEAIREMGERTMVPDLKAFAAMLIQTERLGTSLAQALKVHSDSLRTIRRQKAEEAAAKIAVKLLFPLVFFIFPALLIVILGPGVLRIIKTFGEF